MNWDRVVVVQHLVARNTTWQHLVATHQILWHRTGSSVSSPDAELIVTNSGSQLTFQELFSVKCSCKTFVRERTKSYFIEVINTSLSYSGLMFSCAQIAKLMLDSSQVLLRLIHTCWIISGSITMAPWECPYPSQLWLSSDCVCTSDRDIGPPRSQTWKNSTHALNF